jgi:hypothetical protein
MTTNIPTTPNTRAARQPVSASRCPECGITENTGDFARIPRILRRLPILAVTTVLIVMLALLFIPRLTSPLGQWWPSWRSMRVPDGSGMVPSFITGDFRIAHVRSLVATNPPTTRPPQGLAQALLDEVRTRPYLDAGTKVVVYTQPPAGRLRHWTARGWPMHWKSTDSTLRYRDGPNRTGLQADPDYPFNEPDSTTIRSLSWWSQVWAQARDGEQVGRWDRTIYPLAWLLPIALAILTFELSRPVFAWLSARGWFRARAHRRRRSSTAAASCAAMLVLAVLTISMTASQQQSTWLELTESRNQPRTTLLEMPLSEFERLCAAPDADRALAQRLIDKIDIYMSSTNAVFVGTESGRSRIWNDLSLSMDSAVAGGRLVHISTIQHFDAEGNAVPSRLGPINISVDSYVPALAIAFRLPFDATTKLHLSIWLHALLFWSTIAFAAMYTARLTRHLYRRAVTTRRRRKGECLHCRYHLRPT